LFGQEQLINNLKRSKRFYAGLAGLRFKKNGPLGFISFFFVYFLVLLDILGCFDMTAYFAVFRKFIHKVSFIFCLYYKVWILNVGAS